MAIQNDRFNADLILEEKIATANLLHLRTCEEQILQQKSKMTWPKLGDGNNAFFHASVHEKNSTTGIVCLKDAIGQLVSSLPELEEEVLRFYSGLVGTAQGSRTAVDLVVLRAGKQLNDRSAQQLIVPINTQEIQHALNGIGDTKASRIDRFNAKFFKATWHVMKDELSAAVLDFFANGRMYKAMNCTLVTLIPKVKDAN